MTDEDITIEHPWARWIRTARRILERRRVRKRRNEVVEAATAIGRNAAGTSYMSSTIYGYDVLDDLDVVNIEDGELRWIKDRLRYPEDRADGGRGD